MIDSIRIQCEKWRNQVRLAEYKARRAEFIRNYSFAPDMQYAAYYGEDTARYIEARANYYWLKDNPGAIPWWMAIDRDREYINSQDSLIINSTRKGN